MKNLLFLVHRIPYPPNKGDKIRSYNFLKGLAKNYNIYLAAFIDDVEDWQYVDKVENLTASSFFVNLNPSLAKIQSLSGFFTKKALSIPYYHNNKVQQWVNKTIRENKIEKIFIYSSVMAQYIEVHQTDCVIDFVDVDSDKWLQYSQKAKWPMSWIYKREAKLLLEFDAKVAKLAKMSIFVSQEESQLFSNLVDINPKKISFVNNGVDTEYFSANKSYNLPYNNPENIIVFTGAMDYWANVDAVTWFVREVLPRIKHQCASAQFYIVGSNPTKDVHDLTSVEGVFVTGRVEDIRPYLKFSSVVVAPLLIARGIQNKVLEAMAMGKKIIATRQAIEGIKITSQEVYIKDNAEDFARQVLLLLDNTQASFYVEENRQFVQKNFSWGASLKQLTHIIETEQLIKPKV
ncbi:TIGR03087 family PEP-CTERM/XrtA system glycosyltransferase [methanotrophic endosymbiont of Bathymodiolus puteoserpentis (Logatchev)]|jgi:sugar transferase (PEP-CTERM/EpsH1 system associated)|uniref:TIGR03087 family PEP-CTERM/XrtA system glycosyltransferase n=1 Tax=methanotrophic endosymbiont of Bathymodiolus puteoserpentis (Logatchev) TaxID=343235 RepID=UPI0013C7D425|nr:TIGR03087 family PEP-CTERM/XrtA system glycosyltransferase [methanotrophic endosymbiont of Bathymodiolus puteoserpentis (Logatchev)]SHE23669.1 FIG137776: Glycosyltransferase [methanotrophic endosymbiont of Bathymodiolus puteoserpentis (Logatchev)]